MLFIDRNLFERVVKSSVVLSDKDSPKLQLTIFNGKKFSSFTLGGTPLLSLLALSACGGTSGGIFGGGGGSVGGGAIRALFGCGCFYRRE